MLCYYDTGEKEIKSALVILLFSFFQSYGASQKRGLSPFRGADMAREFAGNFYKTQMWKDCRTAYIKSVGGLCERCLRKGLIKHGDTVHHKIHLTAENINNPEITLNPDNLELLCRDCHADEHRTHEKRYTVEPDGRVRTLP